MLELLLWLIAALTLAIGTRYLIAKWLGPIEHAGVIDKTEVRMQSGMRWFSAFWPNSSNTRKHDH